MSKQTAENYINMKPERQPKIYSYMTKLPHNHAQRNTDSPKTDLDFQG